MGAHPPAVGAAPTAITKEKRDPGQPESLFFILFAEGSIHPLLSQSLMMMKHSLS